MTTYYHGFIDDDGYIVPPNDFSKFKVNNIIAKSREFSQVINLAKKIAATSASILITGSSGVGKEVMAEFIYLNSGKKEMPFIKLNCASIPDNLLESELFGYEPGAFSGALKSGKKGIVEMAEGGTLFLDEIGEMPSNLQPKMLRVLQDGKYYKIGATTEFKADFRIISATNENLEKKIRNKEFREDLYYRLNVIPLHIPDLVNRKDDIPILILYFLKYFNDKYNMHKKLSIDLMKYFLDYAWPGNIRELKNTVERLVLISMNQVITIDDYPYSQYASSENDTLNNYKSFFDNTEDYSLKKIMTEFESAVIIQAVKKHGSIRKAAKVLKIDASTLSRKINSYKSNE